MKRNAEQPGSGRHAPPSSRVGGLVGAPETHELCRTDEETGRALVDVIDLAEALPYNPRPNIEYPPLADRLRERKAA